MRLHFYGSTADQDHQLLRIQLHWPDRRSEEELGVAYTNDGHQTFHTVFELISALALDNVGTVNVFL